MSTWIVAGIDGSGSRRWRNKHDGSNSHVYKFVWDAVTPQACKFFWDGPPTSGAGSAHIATGVFSQIHQALVGLGVVAGPGEVDPRRYSMGWPTRYDNDRRGHAPMPDHDTRICLVGHSRGGLIAVMVANMLRDLRVPVELLCLYDAVDRYYRGDASTIRNVRWAFHALRDPSMWSRVSFGNDALSISGGILRKETFRTSHGGIGGDPDMSIDDDEWLMDHSCDGVSEHVMAAMGREDQIECLEEMRRADGWMRSNARQHGLRFTGR